MAAHHEARSVVDAFGDAFNAKDHEAFGALFTDDAVFVNIIGGLARGRETIAQEHRHGFATSLASAHWAWTSVDTMVLTDDVTVCHAQWNRTRLPDAPPATLPPGTGVVTFVLRKAEGNWKIAAATNVLHTKPENLFRP